jgi:TorA maturation chaperone TorD
MSETIEQPVPASDEEEQARANFYALLARLFYAPPDEQFLRGVASSDDVDAQPSDSGEPIVEEAGSLDVGSLDATWLDLVRASTNADEAAIAEEYNALFVGSGRSEISLYLGAYTARSSVDTKLVALREFLAARGIQRQTAVHEPEDHVAMLFEVMRYLICDEESSIDEQRLFFDRYVWSGGILLCDAILAHDRAQFFSRVAAFAKSFLLIEHDAFEM